MDLGGASFRETSCDTGLSVGSLGILELWWEWEYDVCEEAGGVGWRELGAPDVTGESTTGDVGELRSLEADESFVHFFFRNPKFGMRTKVR